MDQIEALIDHQASSDERDELHIAVNGESLDYFLSAESGRDLRGLSPAWLTLAAPGAEAEELRATIAEQSDLDKGDQLLPILICPDDSDSGGGPAVLVEVHPAGDRVHWLRFGLGSVESPTGAEEVIEWLEGPGPLQFDRRQYLDCLDAFKHRPQPEASPDWKPGLQRPGQFLYWLYALYGGLFCTGSGTLNLPALAYLQVQYELAETPDPPKWAFARLLPVSGLLALGLGQDERRLLVIGQNGRELFKLSDGRREARSADRQISGQGQTAVAEGLGSLAGHPIPLWGPLGRSTPPDLLREARLISNGLSRIRAVLSAAEDRLLIVGQEDGIYIFHRL